MASKSGNEYRKPILGAFSARDRIEWAKALFLLMPLCFMLFGCSEATGREEGNAAKPGAASGVSARAPEANLDEPDTLRLLYWQAPNMLNPYFAKGIKDWAACRITYEPLASFDKDGKMIPFLASEIPSLENGGVASDGKSVTWKLRQGIRWSDGAPFTASDVLFTYEFVSNRETESTISVVYDAIERVEVVDDYTVRVHFKNVNPAWALPFVGNQGMILPRHVFQDYNGNKARKAPANLKPVGTGPYRVEKFRTEEVLFLGTELIETVKIVYERNPYFRDADKVYFSRVELKGGGTVEEAARLVLKSGEYDFAFYLMTEPRRLAQLEKDGKGKVSAQLSPLIERILLNQTDPRKPTEDGERSSTKFPNPYLADKRVRKAIAYAINREAILEACGPIGKSTANVLELPAAYSSPHTRYEFDPQKAVALLDEAGWHDTDKDGIREKNGVKLSVIFQTLANPQRQMIQNVVKKELEAIGIEVELKMIDSGIFNSSDPSNPNTRYHFYADLEMFATGNRSPDPGAYMKGWTCNDIPQRSNKLKGNNVERWCNPDYDALYEQSNWEIDPNKRNEIFIRMNDRVVDDMVNIPLFQRMELHGISNSLEGVEFTPWDSELWNIKDWKRRASQ